MISKEEEQVIFGNIARYIKKAFINPETMERDIDMKAYFPQMEWFNIACIHAQSPSAIYVNSIDAWDRKYGTKMYVARGEKSSKVLIPSVKNNQIVFEVFPVFDISQLQNSSRIPAPRSAIFSFLEGYGGLQSLEMLLNIQNSDWSHIFNHIIGLVGNIHDEERLRYFRGCIEYMMGLRPHIEASGICCCNNQEAMIYLYRLLLNCIDIIPYYVSKLAKEANLKQMDEKELKAFKIKKARGVKERIKDSGLRLQLIQKERDSYLGMMSNGSNEENMLHQMIQNEEEDENHLTAEELDEDENPYNQEEISFWEAII